MQYTYECELWRGEKEWCIEPFGIEGITQGENVEDVCESAADLLREIICDYLIRGEQPPKATFGSALQHEGVRAIVSVEVSLDNVEKVSASEAARILHVSRSRITAMIEAGLLDAWRDGRNTWVSRASVDARFANPCKPGRPKKSATHNNVSRRSARIDRVDHARSI